MKKAFLYPLSLNFGLIVYLRNKLYDSKIFKSYEFDVPVISIGNITVGGTGKTPHTEYLVDLLRKQFNVVTVSRGYKRKTKGYKEVEVTSTALEVGDEPLQIKNSSTIFRWLLMKSVFMQSITSESGPRYLM
jgi:tetraacyldisaccharide 4'-kinase